MTVCVSVVLFSVTSEDLKFGQNRHELIVVDPACRLMLLPQSSEGLIV